jgi:RNA polymerase sigma factor (sigma-70 family)
MDPPPPTAAGQRFEEGMSGQSPTLSAEDLLTHAAWLRRLAARLVESSTADDLVQDTFVAALKSRPDTSRPLRPWLAEVLRNLVRNHARGSGRWVARAARVAAEPGNPLPTAEQLLAEHETRRMVAELVSQLQEPFRSTVLLCYGQGLAPAEVASRQGIPAGTVRWRLKRGLDDLRAALDARHGSNRQAWLTSLAPLAAGATGAAAVGTAAAAASTGLKVALFLAATAVGLWVGTRSFNSPGPADEGASAGQAAGRSERRSGPGASALAEPGGPAAGSAPGPGRPGTLLAAAAPAGANAPGEPGAPGAPSAEVIRRVMEVGKAPTRGDPRAPVTIVMFSDFQCPFCARVQPTLTELQAAYPDKIRLVWKYLPLLFHEHAKLAAEAAMAANEQGKFWPMHDRLFQNQDALHPVALELHARAIGLDMPRYRKAMDEKRFLPTVEADMRLAREAGLNGTPTFFFNGVKVSGAQSLETYKAAVDRALSGDPPSPRPDEPAEPSLVQRAQTAARAAQPGASPSKGHPAAAVTIVQYADFECPFSAKQAPLLDALIAAHPDDVRVVWKNRPLPPHLNAVLAAEAAMAAHEQGKFWPMHDHLFANQRDLSLDALVKHADAIGVDLPRFRQAIDEHRFRKLVEQESALASEAGIFGTPGAIVNGRWLVTGSRPLETWKAIVEREVARSRGLTVVEDPTLTPWPRPAAPPALARGGRRIDVDPRIWPPPRRALSDHLLGPTTRLPIPTGDAPVLGAPRAPVEVLYLNDYACQGCGKGKVLVDGLHRTYGQHLRIIARPVPLVARDRQSSAMLVAEAAWAAHAQGKFWQMHDKLFSEQSGFDRPTVELYATEIGLHMDDFRAALDSGRYRPKVQEDLDLLAQANWRDRPLFVVNGRLADGPVALLQLVETGLQKAGIKLAVLPPARLVSPVPTAQAFPLEERDASWADRVENELSPLLERDLRTVDPTVVGVKLECRRQLCRLVFRSATARPALRGFVKQVYGAELPAAGPPDEAYLSLRNGRDLITARDAIARLRSRRATVLYSLRTGRTPPDQNLPLARLPRD